MKLTKEKRRAALPHATYFNEGVSSDVLFLVDDRGEKEKVHKREVSMQAKVEGTKLEKGRPQEQVVFRQFKQAFRAPKWACEDCEI